MPATKAFEKTSIYHSTLVQAGGLTVKLGAVRPSKFKKGTFTIAVRVTGEEAPYWYQIENDYIKDLLEGLERDPNGDTAWLQIRALGSREDADIMIEDAAGHIVTPSMPPTTQGPPDDLWEGGEPTMPATQRVQEASFSDPLAAKYLGCLEAARLAVAEYYKRHGAEPTEAIRNVATTIYIQNGRSY